MFVFPLGRKWSPWKLPNRRRRRQCGGGHGDVGGNGGGGSCISYTFPGNIRWFGTKGGTRRGKEGSGNGNGGGLCVRSIEPRMRTLFGCDRDGKEGRQEGGRRRDNIVHILSRSLHLNLCPCLLSSCYVYPLRSRSCSPWPSRESRRRVTTII